VIQNLYFPSPQSANVGLAFSPAAGADGNFEMYVSGGFENKVWVFVLIRRRRRRFSRDRLGGFESRSALFRNQAKRGEASRADYNKGKAALYPTGLAVTADGNTLVTANNLGDSVTIVRGLRGARRMERVDLPPSRKAKREHLPVRRGCAGKRKNARAYVSCWNDSSVAVISLSGKGVVGKYITVGRHPTAMTPNAGGHGSLWRIRMRTASR